MIEPPAFKNFVKWHGEEDSPINRELHVRGWLLKRLPYEIILKGENDVDLRDIGEITSGPWSAYGNRGLDNDKGLVSNRYYFFKEEVDAMAFKLKFL